jgi:hypothetical protein
MKLDPETSGGKSLSFLEGSGTEAYVIVKLILIGNNACTLVLNTKVQVYEYIKA